MRFCLTFNLLSSTSSSPFPSTLSHSPSQSAFLSHSLVVSPRQRICEIMLIQIDYAVNLNFNDISPVGSVANLNKTKVLGSGQNLQRRRGQADKEKI